MSWIQSERANIVKSLSYLGCVVIFIFLSSFQCALAADNWLISVNKPFRPAPVDAGILFDENVNYSPNFAVFQRDSRLSDLFGANGKSGLCFPSALAQELIYLRYYHPTKFNALQLPGISQNGSAIDPAVLVRALASSCRTDINTGTVSPDALKCILSSLTNSGYRTDRVKMITPDLYPNAGEPIEQRAVNVDDIRKAMKDGAGVIMEVGWYSYDLGTKSYKRTDGHYFSVVGYSYQNSWGAEQILLNVINPDFSYDRSGMLRLGDSIAMVKTKVSPTSQGTSMMNYSLMGNGFERRNFVERIFVILPN